MKWNPDSPTVPLDADGNMVSYATYTAKLHSFPNFVAPLQLRGVYRGRSAATIRWMDDSGRSYPMFLTDLEHLLMNATVENGRTNMLEWKAVKRGQNYGIAMVDQLDVMKL